MLTKGFVGWYYKHQLGDDTIAFIPGKAESGAFVQMISSNGSRQFDISSLSANGDTIHADHCLFSPRGCKIDLPGVSGTIAYGKPTPLGSDIMGSFRFLPMECRHGVISMAHTLRGGLTVDGVYHGFDGGIGYAETDSGTSFPSAYQWLQCNDFPSPCSIMVSIADIPLCGLRFTGCICAVLYGGREYRLATYRGVRILAAKEARICLSQGKLLLNVDISPSQEGHPLYAPVDGQMRGVIRESMNAAIRARLWERGSLVLDLHSRHAAYEYVKGG